MDDRERALLAQVSALVEEEHRLRERMGAAEAPDEDRSRLRHVEEELDQCWDLLRQRRALRAADRDPGEAHVRPVSQVEGYLPRS